MVYIELFECLAECVFFPHSSKFEGRYVYVYMYRRSGNFRVKKLSYDKFSCKIIFVGTTPYRISVNSAC